MPSNTAALSARSYSSWPDALIHDAKGRPYRTRENGLSQNRKMWPTASNTSEVSSKHRNCQTPWAVISTSSNIIRRENRARESKTTTRPPLQLMVCCTLPSNFFNLFFLSDYWYCVTFFCSLSLDVSFRFPVIFCSSVLFVVLCNIVSLLPPSMHFPPFSQ